MTAVTAGLATPFAAGGQAGVPARHTYNLGLQGMRGIAILLVLLNHADVPGRVTLHIGCAKDKAEVSAQLQALDALPTKAIKRAQP